MSTRLRPLAALLTASITLPLLAPSITISAPPDKAACVAAYEETQTLKKAGKLSAAKVKSFVCAQSACPAFVRDQCAVWNEEIDKTEPSIVVVATDAEGNDVVDVKVEIDGTAVATKIDGAAIALDPGEHKLTFTRNGETITTPLVARTGDKNRKVRVRFTAAADTKPDEPKPDEPKPDPTDTPKPDDTTTTKTPDDPADHPIDSSPRERPTPASVYVVGAIGVVAVGGFALFGAMGNAKKSDLESRGCKPNCPQSDVDAGKRDYLLGDISLGVAVVALGTATILYFTRPEVAHEAQSSPQSSKGGVRWGAAPTRSGGMGFVEWRF